MLKITEVKIGDTVRWNTTYYINDGNLAEVLDVDKFKGQAGAVKVTYNKHDNEVPDAYWEFANKDGVIASLAPLGQGVGIRKNTY